MDTFILLKIMIHKIKQTKENSFVCVCVCEREGKGEGKIGVKVYNSKN